jgi:hypothetical protein
MEGTAEVTVDRPVPARGNSKGSLRDRIKEAQDDRREMVEVEEWGVTVEVRSMTGKERAQTLQRYLTEDNEIDWEALYPELVIASTFDPDTGERVFSPDDGDWLNEKNAGALEHIGQVAMRLSGLDRRARERSGKGSSETGSGGSSTT